MPCCVIKYVQIVSVLLSVNNYVNSKCHNIITKLSTN